MWKYLFAYKIWFCQNNNIAVLKQHRTNYEYHMVQMVQMYALNCNLIYLGLVVKVWPMYTTDQLEPMSFIFNQSQWMGTFCNLYYFVYLKTSCGDCVIHISVYKLFIGRKFGIIVLPNIVRLARCISQFWHLFLHNYNWDW